MDKKKQMLNKLDTEIYKEIASTKTDSLMLTCLTLSRNKEVFLSVFNSINDTSIEKSFEAMENAANSVSNLTGLTKVEISKKFNDAKKVLEDDKKSLLNIIKPKK